MKKRVLCYLVAIFATLSLESCVTNYTAVNTATPQSFEFKNDAKTAALNTEKLEADKREILKSFQAAELAKKESAKSLEIAAAVKHSKLIDGILQVAESYLGTPYRFGGTTRNGIDCSAFVLSVFNAAADKILPRVAAAQSQQGTAVSRENLQKGDLLFFSQGRGISHVAIVYDVPADGPVRFIHAATSRGVMISNITDSYWAPKFRFAKRIIPEHEETPNLAVN